MAIGAGLALLTVTALWPVLGNGFTNFDDDLYVTQNPELRNGLGAEGFRWAWTTGHAANWHPLTWLSHLLDYELYGLDPWGHHLTSLLWHVANTILLFLLLEALTGATWRGAVVAALFAVHPLHVESVAWVAERKDVLSTFFWLLTLAAYVAWVRRPSPARYGAVLLALALGLAAKPMLVTVPFVLLLLDYWPLGRWGERSPGRLVVEKLPLFALAAASSVITVIVQHAGEATRSIAQVPLGERLANAVLAYVGYLQHTLWPSGLAVFYPHRGATATAGLVLAAAALLALVSAAVLAARNNRPYLVTGWLWYLGTLVPVIGLLQVGEQGMADRYTYVPLIGVLLAAVWGIADLAGPGTGRARLRPWLAGAAAIAILACATLSRAQAGHWKDSVTLFRHALAVTSDNATAHLNLALALSERGEHAEAAEQLQAALRLRPRWAKAHNNLGVALSALGREDEAHEHYRAALSIDPLYADAHYNLGLSLAERGAAEQALSHFRRALESDPGKVEAHYNAGTLLAGLRRFDEAAGYFRRTVELDPAHAMAHYNLGAVLLLQGRYAEAQREMELAARHGFSPPEPMLEQLREKLAGSDAGPGER